MNDVATVSVLSHGSFVFAIKTDNSLWGWGSNRSSGTSELWLNPVHIMDDVIAVSHNNHRAMIVRSDNSLWAWAFCHLVACRSLEEGRPVHVMDDVVNVTVGGVIASNVNTPGLAGNTMVIRTDGSLWAWGDGTSGVLGTGSSRNEYNPVHIMDNVIAVSAGINHTMALQADGSLWAWGRNHHGQLGDANIITSRFTPTHIMDNVIAVSTGIDHTMALKTDGSLWAWGAGHRGLLGTGLLRSERTPVHIMDNVVAVSTSIRHTIALKEDGSLWAWGAGFLGDGVDRTDPSDIVTLPIKILEDLYFNRINDEQ